MSATLTHRPEAPNSVSDYNEVAAPKNTGRRFLIVAAVAIVALGIVVTNGNTDDGSNAFAETQRMQSLAPSADSSYQFAENLRFAAIGGTVDSSVQFAETQRMIAAGTAGGTGDDSHEFAEFQRMQALADTSWQVAEDRRFAALDPNGK